MFKTMRYVPPHGVKMIQVTEDAFLALISDKKLLREALAELMQYADGWCTSQSADKVFDKAEAALEATK